MAELMNLDKHGFFLNAASHRIGSGVLIEFDLNTLRRQRELSDYETINLLDKDKIPSFSKQKVEDMDHDGDIFSFGSNLSLEGEHNFTIKVRVPQVRKSWRRMPKSGSKVDLQIGNDMRKRKNCEGGFEQENEDHNLRMRRGMRL